MRTIYRLVGSSPRPLSWISSIPAVSDDRVYTAIRHSEFKPIQRRPEIIGLAALVRSRGDRALLEIGTARGGTSLLLARALRRPATVVSVDLAPRCRTERLGRAFPWRTTAHLRTLDSHRAESVGTLRELQPSGYDVVFIDGDHSYDGVRLDAMRFAPLARPGGMLVFHDIVPVAPTDHSGIFVGGVPDWWSQISTSSDVSTRTFVADGARSGFGIGVVELPGSRTAVDELLQVWAALPVRD